ncbi:MAG: hypothetical protein WD004_06385 [Actinomycetota bacterium]
MEEPKPEAAGEPTRQAKRKSHPVRVALITIGCIAVVVIVVIFVGNPTYDNRESAQRKAAQSSLRNAMAAAKTVYVERDDYGLVSAKTLMKLEPILTFTSGESKGPLEVAWRVDDVVTEEATFPDTQFSAAVRSESGECMYISDAAAPPFHGGTFYGSGDVCTADAARQGATNTTW